MWDNTPPGPLLEEMPVLADPGRETVSEGKALLLALVVLLFCALPSLPSSDPTSVIREDIMLGGPLVVLGNWGKVSSSSPRGPCRAAPSFKAMVASCLASTRRCGFLRGYYSSNVLPAITCFQPSARIESTKAKTRRRVRRKGFLACRGAQARGRGSRWYLWQLNRSRNTGITEEYRRRLWGG